MEGGEEWGGEGGRGEIRDRAMEEEGGYKVG